MLFNYFILIQSFLLPKLVTINKKNSVINNVKMGFEELDNDYDEYGNIINNTFNFVMNQELNSTNDSNNFPSFYKFLKNVK